MTRRIAAAICGVVAVVGLLASVVAVWAHEVAFDSRSVANGADEALRQPEVVAALAGHLTNRLFESVPIEAAIGDALPDGADRLGPVLIGGARLIVRDGFERLLAQEATRELVVAAVGHSHAALIAVLDGELDLRRVRVEGGQVTLNLLPLLGRVLLAVQGVGLFPRVEVPELLPGGDPHAQIAALEDAFGVDLPEDLGQVVVFDSEAIDQAGARLAAARRVLQLVRRFIVAILATTVVTAALAVGLSVRRRRAVALLAGGAALTLLVGRFLVQSVVDAAPSVARETGGQVAIETVVGSLTSSLFDLLAATMVVAVLVAVGLAVVGLRPRFGGGRGSPPLTAPARAPADAGAP